MATDLQNVSNDDVFVMPPYCGVELEGIGIGYSEDGSAYFLDNAELVLNLSTRYAIGHSSFGKGFALPNGSMLYYDRSEMIRRNTPRQISNLVEIATAPSNNPSILAQQSFHALRVLNAKYRERNLGNAELIFQSNRLYALANQGNLPLPNFRIGVHQNILIPEHIDEDFLWKFQKDVIPFLASCYIATGEGFIDERGMLLRSYRGYAVSNEVVTDGTAVVGVETIKIKKESTALTRRLEFRTADFSSSNSSEVLSNGMLMLACGLHFNGLEPDISDELAMLEKLEISGKKEIFGYFGGEVTDIEAAKIAVFIQMKYFEASKLYVKQIDDAVLQRCFKSVLNIWEESLKQTQVFIVTGKAPNNAVAGWLVSQHRKEQGLTSDSDLLRDYGNEQTNSQDIHLMKCNPSSNRYFAMLLDKAVKENSVTLREQGIVDCYLYQDWEKLIISHQGVKIQPSLSRLECAPTLEMPIGSDIGTGKWVKENFGTYQPSNEQLVNWLSELVHNFEPPAPGIVQSI